MYPFFPRLYVFLLSCLFLAFACATAPDRPDHPQPGLQEESPEPFPDDPGGNHYYHFIMAQMAGRQGDLEAAETFLGRALAARPDDVYLKKELLYLYLQQGNQDDTMRLVEDILAMNPYDADALIIAATVRQQQGEPEEAAVLLERVLENDPGQEKIYLVLGDLYLTLDDADRAAVVYEKMTRQFPDQWDAYFLLGRVYSRQGRLEEAEENFKTSLSLEPELLSPRFALVELYKKRLADGSAKEAGAGYVDTVINLYKTMLEDYPEEYRAALELAMFYHEVGKEDKAAELLMFLGEKSREDEMVIQYVNQLYIESRKYDKARLIIDGMLRAAPDDSTLHYVSGMLFNRVDEYQQAIDHFVRVKPDSDYYRQARVQLALLYEEIGEEQKAADLFAELIAEGAENADFFLYAGSFYERRGEHQQAKELYRQGLELDPANADLHFRLGVIHDKAEEKDKVIARMKEVLKIDPEDANALNYLGYTYAEMGINLEEAIALIEKAMEIEPDNGYITDSLGWVYFQKGNMEKAIKYLEEAVRLVPDDPILLDHLGDAYARDGDPETALKYYHLSLEYSKELEDPDLKVQKAVQEKIELLRQGLEAP